MNEYQRFIKDELDRRNWRPADMEKHGGPSRQTMSNIMNDTRRVLTQRPSQEIVEKIATAFRIPVEPVLIAVAKAMGFPVEVTAADLENASDDDLLEEIRKRMKREGNAQHDSEPDPPTPLRVVEDDHAEDAVPEQKTRHAAFEQGLGEGIGPDDIYEDS